MASRAVLSRASRIKTKLQSALEPTLIEVEDVSYQHAGHAAVRETGANETHFNLRIVSSKFDGQNLVKRHRMVYDLLSDELQSGLHALSIVAKTPKENGIRSMITYHGEETVPGRLFARFHMVETELSHPSLCQASLLFELPKLCTFELDGKWLVISWKGTPIISASAWKFQ